MRSIHLDIDNNDIGIADSGRLTRGGSNQYSAEMPSLTAAPSAVLTAAAEGEHFDCHATRAVRQA